MDFAICINMGHTKIYYLHRGDKIPFYVGKTKNEYHRLFNHKKTFGENTFMEIISEVLDWRYWEKFYIEEFKKQGYKLDNRNNGGGGLEKWTKESIQKLKSHPTRGKKIGLTHKGMNKSHKGKLLSEEHKNKIKETRGFLKGRPNTWQSKSILQYDLNENLIREFVSQQEAQYIMGKPNSDGIGSCCRGKQKTAYGYKWKYKQ